MKIEAIETHIIQEWLVVRVHTDNGLSGIGEATFWAHPSATADVVDKFSKYLIGKDPLTRGYHWLYLYRSASFRGASICAALSAIDVALWDIAGKHYGAPVHALLGGKHRDRIRMLAICAADTVDNAVASTTAAAREGHTAVKITPFPPDFAHLSHARIIKEAVDRTAAVREAVGPDVDIGLEIHRNLTPGLAIALAKKLEPFDILFYEDPVQPDSIDSMAEVASKVTVPIATGERHLSMYEFKEFLQRRATNDLKLDVGLQGGFSQCIKAAGMAEAYHATVSPHNAWGPVLLAAHVQLCAAIPNFLVLEYRPDPKDDMVTSPLRAENGYIKVPDTPGIGVESTKRRRLNTRTSQRTSAPLRAQTGPLATADSPLRMLQQHEPLQKYLSDIYPYVFVDELRDTSLLQLELLKSLVDLGSSVVFGVADEDQVLYEWRDARLETINEFENYFRAAPRFLVLNYRSPEPIVTVANTLIRTNPDRYEEELKSAVTDRPGAVYIHSDSDSEADFLAKSLVMAIEEDGRSPQEFALI